MTIPVHRMTIYNPGRLTDEEVIASFVARRSVFDRICDDLRQESQDSSAQHHLIVGQRGMGKTTLLMRFAAELRQSPWKERFVPLVFAEEQYAVDRLSKFWMNCLDSLADACERIGYTAQAENIDKIVRTLEAQLSSKEQNEDDLAREALQKLLTATNQLQRRPVLLVDNIQIVFERIGQQQHVLRELLMRPGAPILIAASPTPPPATLDYGQAFYDHFKTHYLKQLMAEEMRGLIISLAERADRSDVLERVTLNPGRLNALHQLTGGNPRTAVLLFHLYAEDFSPTVFGDLEQLLDRVTPLYKARFEELSPQMQVVAGAMANHWDPVASRDLAELTGLQPNQITPQLDRLQKLGFVEEVSLFDVIKKARDSRKGYQIAERFFNVWYLMRNASRRQRKQIEFLTRFLESFYAAEERTRLARSLIREEAMSPDRMLFMLALHDTLDDPNLAADTKRHAELKALFEKKQEALRELKRIIDFDVIHPAVRNFAELRNRLESLVPEDAGISPNEFADTVLGDRTLFLKKRREAIASQGGLNSVEVKQIIDTCKSSRDLDITRFDLDAVKWFYDRLKSGQIRSLNDQDDWNRTFEQAATEREGDKDLLQMMTETTPLQVGRSLSEHVISYLEATFAPDSNHTRYAWMRWSFILNDLGRYEEAEQSIRQALRIAPEDEYVWFRLSDNLLCQQRYIEAEVAAREAIALEPTDEINWRILGDSLSHQRRYVEFEQASRRAIELNPENTYNYKGLGDALSWQDRYEESEAAYRRATELDPEYSEAWNALGIASSRMHRYDEAEQAIRKTLAIEPEVAEHYHSLVFFLRDRKNDTTEARIVLAEMMRLLPDRLEELCLLQDALFAAYDDNWGVTTEKLSAALDMVPDSQLDRKRFGWNATPAVLVHLGYGKRLLALLEERGDNLRLRPWYEAIQALYLGDRNYLRNVAPEVRSTAEEFFDSIVYQLDSLPERTSRRQK